MPYYVIYGDYGLRGQPGLGRSSSEDGTHALDMVIADDEEDAVITFLARHQSLEYLRGDLQAVRVPQFADAAFLSRLTRSKSDTHGSTRP
ncbi:hypothetical protein K8R78_04860 [bacterium]|nr:hypothetical protein [bacterium]